MCCVVFSKGKTTPNKNLVLKCMYVNIIFSTETFREEMKYKNLVLNLVL